MHLVRAADCRRARWKNGGGETAEIAVFPPGAGLDRFDWRISRAAVEADGPFSLFPGVDRSIALLAGAGLELRAADGRRWTLTPASPPLTVPADIELFATLLAGPVADLNLMCRRGRYAHTVEAAAAGRVEAGAGEVAALFAVAALRLSHDGEPTALEAGDTAFLDPGDVGRWAGGKALVLRIRPL